MQAEGTGAHDRISIGTVRASGGVTVSPLHPPVIDLQQGRGRTARLYVEGCSPLVVAVQVQYVAAFVGADHPLRALGLAGVRGYGSLKQC